MEYSNHPAASSHRQTQYQMLAKIGKCLRQGCIICIEHSPILMPRYSPWKIWGQPSCFNGDENHLFAELDNCCNANPSEFVRLGIEDFSCHSRFTFVVYSPTPS